MERRSDGSFVTSFENMLEDTCKVLDENPDQIVTVRLTRFKGELFGSFHVSGKKVGNYYELKVDDVLPEALGSFFLGIVMVKGQINPGGIYTFTYIPRGKRPNEFDKLGSPRGGFSW